MRESRASELTVSYFNYGCILILSTLTSVISRRNSLVVATVMATLFGYADLVDGYALARTKDQTTNTTLKIRLAQWPKDFEPHRLTKASSLLNTFAHASLLDFHQKTGQYLPYVAESYTYSNNHKTLNFLLRKGVKFTDGTQLTAQDVHYSLQRLTLDKSCSACKSLAATLPRVTGMKTADNYKISINFKKASRYHHRSIGQIPLIKAPPNKAAFQATEPTTFVGAGPYEISKKATIDGEKITLVRVDSPWMSSLDNHQDHFLFPIIEAVYLKEDHIAFSAFLKGLIHTLTISHETFSAYSEKKQGTNSPAITWLSYPKRNPAAYRILIFNAQAGKTKDKLLREALYHLIPEDKLLRGPTDESLNSQPFFTSSASNYRPKRNPQKALELVRKILNLKPASSIPSGILPLTLHYSELNNAEWLGDFQKNAGEAGIKLNLIYLPLHETVATVKEGHFEGVLLTQFLKHPEDIYEFIHSEGVHNFSGYQSSQMDKLLNKLLLASSKPEKISLEKQIASTLFRSYSMIYLTQEKHHHIAFWPDLVKTGDPAVLPYAGSDHTTPYYRHWQPPVNSN